MLESKFYMPSLASPQLWGWIAIGVGQALEGMAVTPKLVGPLYGK